MHINLEAAPSNTIEAYSNKMIQINSVCYEHSLIVSQQEIITDLAIKHIHDMDASYIDLLIKNKPELILIGHPHAGLFPHYELISQLSKHRIGIECMSIGAACRTYNVLLSEGRAVVAGFIL